MSQDVAELSSTIRQRDLTSVDDFVQQQQTHLLLKVTQNIHQDRPLSHKTHLKDF